VGNTRSAEQFDNDAERALGESLAIRDAIGALDDAYVAEAPNDQDVLA
jgi:hypothetical protein